MMDKLLVAVRLETCHANTDGTAWYAYFDGVDLADLQTRSSFWRKIMRAAAKADGAPLGVDFEEPEEVPNELSKHAGLKRYYVGGAS